MKRVNTLDELIVALNEIASMYGGEIPVSINLIGARLLGLQSICVDDSFGQDVQLFFEADLADKREELQEFRVCSATGRLEEEIKKEEEIQESIRKAEEAISPFINDIDKVYDLLSLENKQEFLKSYSYITGIAYDNTCHNLYPSPILDELDEENEEVINNIACLWRIAENMIIKEMNGENHGWNITGEQLKATLANHLEKNFTEDQREVFEEMVK